MHSTYHHRVPLHMDIRLTCIDDMFTCGDDPQLRFEYESIVFVIGTQELRDRDMGYPLITPGTYAGAAIATHGHGLANMGSNECALMRQLFEAGVQITARIFIRSQYDKTEARKGELGHTLLRKPRHGSAF